MFRSSDRGDAAAPSDTELLGFLNVASPILDGTETSDTLNWSFDSGTEVFDYLADGETLILNYTVQARDTQNATDSETITIRITGTNDDPVITDGPDAVALTENGSGLTSSGNLTVTDVDTSDEVVASRTLSVSGTSNQSDAAAPSDAVLLNFLTLDLTTVIEDDENTQTLGWSFDTGVEDFDYLAKDETLILTYTVEVEDSEGGKDTETVTIPSLELTMIRF